MCLVPGWYKSYEADFSEEPKITLGHRIKHALSRAWSGESWHLWSAEDIVSIKEGSGLRQRKCWICGATVRRQAYGAWSQFWSGR